MPKAARVAPILAAALLAAPLAQAADEDMSLGSPKAPVTVIEYASPTCPHCALFETEVFPAFKKKYVDTGQVRYVLREAPIHPDLDAAAFLLARCAGPAGYFKVIDGVMKGQDEYYSAFLVDSPNADQEIADTYRLVLQQVGKSVGVEGPRLTACLTNAASVQALNERTTREMRQYDVQSTPTFVVNGVKVQPPSGPEYDLATLDAAIARARGAHARHARR